MSTIAVSGREPKRPRQRRFITVALAALAALAMLLSPDAGAQVLNSSLRKPGSQTPAKVRNGTAVYVKHYDPAKMLRLAIVLTPPRLAEERQFLEDVQNKKSPLFHQFLGNDEWNVRFAPAAVDEQAVVDWAQSKGLTITERYPNRLVVDVEAPAGTIEKAFGVVINNYQVGPDLLYSNDRDPVLPNPAIDSVLGLNSIEHVQPGGGTGRYVPGPDYVPGPPVQVLGSAQKDASPKPALEIAGGVNPADGFQPTDFFSSDYYDYGALMDLGHCCNPLPLNYPGASPPESSIAIAAYGDLSFNDVNNFTAYFSYLAFNVQKVLVYGGYTCVTPPGQTSDINCFEVTMDTEWSLAMANSEGSAASTAKVYVYEGANLNQATQVELFSNMLKDGYARVMSTSWGGNEGSANSGLDYIFSEMVGKGWTLVADSGDQGAYAGCGDALGVQFPSSDPNVVGVGGTKYSATGEVAWTGGTAPGSCSKNNGGSTGGFSAYWLPAPSYQSSFGFAARAVPDMALDAADGHDVYFNGGWIYGTGTSVATPMLAAFFAQENAYLLSIGVKCGSSGTSPCAPLGNANYPIYEEALEHNAGRNPFYDIVTGCNNSDITTAYTPNLAYYCAGPGYDLVTGWGSANMLQLAWAINWELTAATGTPSVTFSGPATNTWYNSNQTVNWTVVDNGGGFPGTGIAGYSSAWDSIYADPSVEPGGGSDNSFYNGPVYPNSSTGCLTFERIVSGSCAYAAGVSQGCHVAYVEGWNNQGISTGVATYGPLCYDTTPPTASASLAPAANTAGWDNQSVTVTLSASDPGGSAASGVKAIYYSNKSTACSATSLNSCQTYNGPFVVT